MAKRLTAEDKAAKQAALDAGDNTYVRPSDGKTYVIRKRENNPKGTGGLPGLDEEVGMRKRTRGGGTGGRRQIQEQLSTPPDADKKAFYDAMADANKQGMDGDHITDVARSGNALMEMDEPRRAQYHERFKNAGVPLGNQAANVTPLDPDTNQRVKPAETRAMDAGIQRAGQEADDVFRPFQGLFRNRGVGAPTVSSGSRVPASSYRRAMGALPGIVGVGGILLSAGQQAIAGDLEGAGSTIVQGGLSEAAGDIPVVGDMIQPQAAADSDLGYPDRAKAQIEENERINRRVQEAQERGGRWNIGGMQLPDLGISERLGFN